MEEGAAATAAAATPEVMAASPPSQSVFLFVDNVVKDVPPYLEYVKAVVGAWQKMLKRCPSQIRHPSFLERGERREERGEIRERKEDGQDERRRGAERVEREERGENDGANAAP
jgi:hypothetical protein